MCPKAATQVKKNTTSDKKRKNGSVLPQLKKTTKGKQTNSLLFFQIIYQRKHTTSTALKFSVLADIVNQDNTTSRQSFRL